MAALGVVALGLLGLAALWWAHPNGASDQGPTAAPRLPPADDPRVTTASRFRNVRPDVKYVGDEACAGCHRALTTTYRQHPMGRSLAPVADAPAIERYTADARDPFEARGLTLAAERRGARVFHRESAPSGGVAEESEVAYAVGSGQRGRSYLIDHDGYLFESPITWYPLAGTWDLSPGYDQNYSHFSRPVVAGCLFCHADQVEPDAHVANRFASPIFRGYAVGCERCHGPGELHVRRQRAGATGAGIDPTIVNPRHLDPALREAVCQQCHLQGEARVLPRGRSYFEFRPGLPLDRFIADFVWPADERPDNKFVGTVEQMYASRCFRESRGDAKLGCTSCHDPHALPDADQRVAFYRDRCMTCHAEHGCSLPRPERLAKQADDSCVACHMPARGGSIVHTSITDHTVPRRADRPAAGATARSRPRAGLPLLVAFPHERTDGRDPDQNRNLGIALSEFARKQEPATGRRLAEQALPLLEAAVAGDPADAAAGEAKASALLQLGRPGPALAACAAVLDREPDRETALLPAAMLANQLHRPAEARAFAERAIRLNPWLWQYRQLLAGAYAAEGDWRRAADACHEAIRLEPCVPTCRELLVTCCLRLGDTAEARRELDALLALVPPAERDAVRRQFERPAR